MFGFGQVEFEDTNQVNLIFSQSEGQVMDLTWG